MVLLKRIIYTSKLCEPYNTRSAVNLIVNSSREFNDVCEIGGHLYWDQTNTAHNILQILEGEASKITDLWTKIRADYRHTDIVILSDNEISERTYFTWDVKLSTPTLSAPSFSSIQDYKVTAVVGGGSTSTVVLGEHRASGVQYAIKMISKRRMSRSSSNQILAERNIMSQTNHPFVQKLLRGFQDPVHIYFVTPFAKRGDLYSCVANTQFTLSIAMFYFCEILCGLEYLHGKGIVHNDLKLENVLICDDGHIAIADFGISFHANSRTMLAGTPIYFAPEVITLKEKTKASDVWALGVMLFEMFAKKVRWQSQNRRLMCSLIVASNLSAEYAETAKPYPIIIELLKLLCDHNHETRPTCAAIAKYLVEAGAVIDWSYVEKKKLHPPHVPNESRLTRDTFPDFDFDGESLIGLGCADCEEPMMEDSRRR